jgi:uroporphyrinogen decarboxylase
VAIDDAVSPEWAAANVQPYGCVQGNLAPRHLVEGGEALAAETRRVVAAFARGPHVFNLGHGITPDASIDNVHRMIEAVKG